MIFCFFLVASIVVAASKAVGFLLSILLGNFFSELITKTGTGSRWLPLHFLTNLLGVPIEAQGMGFIDTRSNETMSSAPKVEDFRVLHPRKTLVKDQFFLIE